MSEKKSDNGLEVLLTEYKSLRDEIKMNLDHQIKIFAIIVSALGVIYTIIFSNEVAGFLVFFIPIFLFPLALRGQHSNYGLKLIGEYLILLEKQIQTYTPNDLYWDGWQHYWKDRKSQANVMFYDAFAKLMLYFVIPVGIAIVKIFCEGLKLECAGIYVNKGNLLFCLILLLLIILIFLFSKSRLDRFDEKKHILMKNIIDEKIEKLIKK